MKVKSQKFSVLIVVAMLQLVNVASAQIQPPNYKFSLDNFKPFYPGQTLDGIEKKHGKGKVVKQIGQVKTYRFYVAHIRYKFPVFVSIYQGKSLDFVAKLPSYFNHDIYHRTLIKEFGKQDKYNLKDGTAFYVWSNKNGNTLRYTGACTITCFPVTFSMEPKEYPEVPNYRPITRQLESTTLF